MRLEDASEFPNHKSFSRSLVSLPRPLNTLHQSDHLPRTSGYSSFLNEYVDANSSDDPWASLQFNSLSKLSISQPENNIYLLPLAFLGLVCGRHHALHDPKTIAIIDPIDIPDDLWLMQGIFIKDVDVKVSLLRDILSWLNLSSFERSHLSYYKKVLLAYNVYEPRSPSVPEPMTPTDLEMIIPPSAPSNAHNQKHTPPRSWRHSTRDPKPRKHFTFLKTGRELMIDRNGIIEEDQEDLVLLSPSTVLRRATSIYSRIKQFASGPSSFHSLPEMPTRSPSSQSIHAQSNRAISLSPLQHNTRLSPIPVQPPQFHRSVSQHSLKSRQPSSPNLLPPPLFQDALDTFSLSPPKMEFSRPFLNSQSDLLLTPPRAARTMNSASSRHSCYSPHLSMNDSPLASPYANQRSKMNSYMDLKDAYMVEIHKLYDLVKTLASRFQADSNDPDVLQVAIFIRKSVVRFIALDVRNMIVDYGRLQLQNFEYVKAI